MKKILIVEDNQDNMDLIKEILEEEEYEVFCTASAENGLEMLNRGISIDLILMDVSLPKLNGYDATRIIKGNEKTSSISVVILTAHAGQEDREKGFKAGCDDFFTKPIVDEEEFLKVIKRNIDRSVEDGNEDSSH